MPSIDGRRFSARGLSPMTTAAGQLTSSAVVMLPIALLVDQPWTLAAPSWPAAGSVVALGLLTGALAYSDLLSHPRLRRRDQRRAGGRS
jgi:drug/metabolite transporter (DMT)-like permease